MRKIVEEWLLFEYVAGKVIPSSKPFQSKIAADKARSKYPERERGRIGLGLIRSPKG
jgi:hypothetical protein